MVAVLQILGIVPQPAPQRSARKTPQSPSLITNVSKRSREDSEGLAEAPDSNSESSSSSSSEDSSSSLEPESEEGVVRDTSIVDQTGGDEAGYQKPALAACKAAKLAAIEVVRYFMSANRIVHANLGPRHKSRSSTTRRHRCWRHFSPGHSSVLY